MSGIVGRHVRWRHKNPDGRPIKDVDGCVEAAALSTSNRFHLLVLCGDGRLVTEEAADLEVVAGRPVYTTIEEGNRKATETPKEASQPRQRRSLLSKEKPE